MEHTGSTSTNRVTFVALSLAAVAWAIVSATSSAWTCDDAFISFRYANNLVHGLGLVFNAGERVEGYSNLLWTLWVALGLRLGIDAETWSIGWGIACHAGSIMLLARRCRRRAEGGSGLDAIVPIAALGAAAHVDWSAFATSGLETSLVTFLGLLGYTLVVEAGERRVRLVWAGIAFGLAAITRPEGMLLGATATLWLLMTRQGRRSDAAYLALPWLAFYLAQLAGRVLYYGDVVPNTYYAKSAGMPWLEQGWTYVRIYFARYALLGVGAALVATALAADTWRRRGEPRPPDPWRAEASLALMLALVQTWFVLQVGGDFMFARLLIPATPFYLILVELATCRLLPRRRDAMLAAGAVAIFAIVLVPHPLAQVGEVSGIVQEQLQYPPDLCRTQRLKGETLRRALAGLPVRIAFGGSEARVVYYSEVPVAIECATGLTDRFIAHRAIERRGRIGHEKHPTATYLLEDRGAQLALHPQLAAEIGLSDSVLAIPAWFGTFRVGVMRWDPSLMRELEARGLRYKPSATRFLASAR